VRRAGGAILVALALLAASPAAAQLPTPAAAQGFVVALQRGSAPGARAWLGREAEIVSIIADQPAPARLTDLLAYVRRCRSGELYATRLLAEPGMRHLHIYWTCNDTRRPEISIEVRNDRVSHVWFGPSRPVYMMPRPPGWRPPIGDVVYEFLLPLVASENFEDAARMLAPDAVLRDNLGGAAPRLADVAAYVRDCALRDVADRGNDLAATHWTCPGGERIVMVGGRSGAISRVELGPPPAGEGAR
jgi:hypothetical protein